MRKTERYEISCYGPLNLGSCVVCRNYLANLADSRAVRLLRPASHQSGRVNMQNVFPLSSYSSLLSFLAALSSLPSSVYSFYSILSHFLHSVPVSVFSCFCTIHPHTVLCKPFPSSGSFSLFLTVHMYL
jgi:hypothetical protein